MTPIVVGDFDESCHRARINPPQTPRLRPSFRRSSTASPVARLNVLRAIREANWSARGFHRPICVRRNDVLQALNRLSSAVYVLMMLVCLMLSEKAVRRTA